MLSDRKKLTTRGGKVPYNLRMGALRGFSVRIPTPSSETIKEMTKESRSRLVNPDDYIVIYGIPKKRQKSLEKSGGCEQNSKSIIVAEGV